MGTHNLPAALLVAALTLAGCSAGGKLATVQPRPGVAQRFWVMAPEPPAKPVAHLILFAGGGGRLELSQGGIGRMGGNFLVRTREAWVAHGFSVALPDAPAGQRNLFTPRTGTEAFRLGADHARDIEAVIRRLKQGADLPVFLVGTSMGTLSAAAIAARVPKGLVDGVVLTSSVFRPIGSGPGGDRVPGRIRGLRGLGPAELGRIEVPTLWVHHQRDQCPITRFSDLPGAMAMETRAPKVEKIIYKEAGRPRGKRCQAFHFHGFIGIEERVVADITRWIKANLPQQ